MIKRTILLIPKTKTEKVLDVLSVLLLVITFLHLIYVWDTLPEKVPLHFNATGAVDGWGGKVSIWILPIVASLLFVMMFIVAKFPHIFNYPVTITEKNAPKLYLESRRMIVIINFEIVLFFSIASWESIQVAFGKEGLSIWYIPALLITLFGTIAISLYRTVRMR
jgi:uncharacterized membrane protein